MQNRQLPQPQIKAGTLDLRQYSLNDGPISLDGQWEFYWHRLIDPASFSPGSPSPGSTYFSLPGFWNDQRAGADLLSPAGYATYRLRILRKPESRILAIRMIDLESAYELYANGKLIGFNGKPGMNSSEEIPEWRPAVHVFHTDGDVDLVLHVSNFNHRLGGVWQAPEIGTQEDLSREQRSRVGLDLFLAAALFAVGIYHALIYILRRTEKSFLLLGLFCLIMGLRSLVVGERFILELFPLEWAWHVKLDYLTVYLGAPVCHWFLFQMYRGDYQRLVLQVFGILSSAAALAVIVLPPLLFTHIAGFYHLLFIIVSLYFTAVTVLAVLRRRPYSIVLMLGWLAFTVANMHDILYVQSFIESRNLFALGLIAFLLTQSYTLAGRYARALTLSEELRERVRSLLDFTRNLNQATEIREAVHQALAAGGVALGSARMRACVQEAGLVYEVKTELSDGNPFAECSPGQISEIAFESVDDSTGNPAIEGGMVRAPARKGQILVELEWEGVSRVTYEREKDFLQGLCDSLALTLDSILSARRATLAAIGQAASEIVHDINHHCRSILQQAQTLRSNPGDGQVIAVNIDRETERLKNMALDILDFARDNIIVAPQWLDLSEIRDQLHRDLEIQFQGTGIDYKIHCNGNGTMPIDPGRFRRVVANLAGNARQALGSSGTFQVLIEREGDHVFFIFEDNGPGLPQEIKSQLMDGLPGAPPHSGGGFGLAVVARIVRGHGGQLHVHDPLSGGTRFTILLPGSTDG